MNTTYKGFNWAENHTGPLLDLVRIYIGIGLFVRGLLFFGNSTLLEAWMGQFPFETGAAALIHYVALGHLFGGLLLALGMATRLAAGLQIPILAGAVFLHLSGGIETGNQSLELSALVLFLLVLFFFRGSGPWSLDAYLSRKEATLAKSTPLKQAGTQPARPIPEVKPVAHPEPVQLSTKPTSSEPQTCSCGHAQDHVMVSPETEYSKLGLFSLLMGIRATPKRIHYRCRQCGEVLATTQAAQVMEQYR